MIVVKSMIGSDCDPLSLFEKSTLVSRAQLDIYNWGFVIPGISYSVFNLYLHLCLYFHCCF